MKNLLCTVIALFALVPVALTQEVYSQTGTLQKHTATNSTHSVCAGTEVFYVLETNEATLLIEFAGIGLNRKADELSGQRVTIEGYEKTSTVGTQAQAQTPTSTSSRPGNIYECERFIVTGFIE